MGFYKAILSSYAREKEKISFIFFRGRFIDRA